MRSYNTVNRLIIFNRLFIFTTILFCSALTAQAQSQRTFVSTSGNDANTASLCSAQNPCRSFGAELGVTTANGEIIALTSGGYGAVAITKAVQITAPTGVYAAITASPANAIGGASGDAIRISAGASDVVVLRGLTINGLGVADGIDFDTGAALHIENCIINGFASRGINFDAAGKLFVKDTIVRNGGGSGIVIFTASGTVTASLDHCRVENNGGIGVDIGSNAQVSISNSLAAGNASSGFYVDSGGKVTISNSTSAHNGGDGFNAYFGGEMTIESCIARGNTFSGMFAFGTGAVMRVSNSTAVNNAFGFRQDASAVFESFSNNAVRGNGNGPANDVVGNIPSITLR